MIQVRICSLTCGIISLNDYLLLLLLDVSKRNSLRIQASYLVILYGSYCKGAFQTVWLLAEALSGHF